MIVPQVVYIYCCYGSMWGSTKRICENIMTIFEEKFKSENRKAEVYLTSTIKEEDLDHFHRSDIVYVASSIMRNVFRANVMNFMRKQKEAVQKKVSAALLVNLPYIHLDDYIPQFEEQIGYKCDVCMTTGGIIDMRLYRSNQGLVRYCMDNRLPDMDPSIEIFGEISTADLELFIDRIINCYKIKHIEEQ